MYYSVSELSKKLKYYKGLPEKARRHFLALEYESLGKGSQRYIAQVFSCSRDTIIKGGLELGCMEAGTLDYSRQRKEGGGRKKKNVQ